MKHFAFIKTLPFIALFALMACDPNNKKAEIYADNAIVKDDNLTITFEKPTESFLQSNFFTMYMYVVSSDPKPQEFTFAQPKIQSVLNVSCEMNVNLKRGSYVYR